MKAHALILIAAISGCTMDGSQSEESKGKTMNCTDIRDGEKFSFNTNAVTNIRIGYGAPSAFDVVDSSGTKRTLRSDMESYIKCTEAKTK